jgi:hypothetical protein
MNPRLIQRNAGVANAPLRPQIHAPLWLARRAPRFGAALSARTASESVCASDSATGSVLPAHLTSRTVTATKTTLAPS